jgi:hypothetical protein
MLVDVVQIFSDFLIVKHNSASLESIVTRDGHRRSLDVLCKMQYHQSVNYVRI